MITPSKIYDGSTEIIYSASFIIYENELVIDGVEDCIFKFTFINDEMQKNKIDWVGNAETKSVNVKLYNFRSPLGFGTPQPFKVLTIADGKEILLSIHGTSLGGDSEFLKISVTFYKK